MKTATKDTTIVEWCDSCGRSQGYGIARAKVRVTFSSGQLHFCNHCYTKMEPKLLALAKSIEKDET